MQPLSQSLAASYKTQFCSLLAQAKGFDPIGRATPTDSYLALEVPLPWPYDILEAELLPPDLTALVMRVREELDYRLRLLCFAPDAEYTCSNHRRVIYFQRSMSPYARLERLEYLVPESELTPLIAALLEQSANLPHFAAYRQPDTNMNVRDIFVRTHGAVDAACGKFGYPTYQLLREQYADQKLRIWRASHFGGHICAPTLLTFPDGRSWAYIGKEQAAALTQHTGDPRLLYHNYRGWSLLDHPMGQVVEREIWMREKWPWFDCHVEVESLVLDPAEQWAEVRIRYFHPSGRQGIYDGRVEVCRQLETIATTNDDVTYTYDQYQVTRLDHLPEYTWQPVKELAQ